ncbi:MAG TPA: carboxymuconolactone decarboxylase family protein [Solirubrobacteraceae bacterium]|nr:carboxymuconolactone decarboxylase family protein [Solirubrobacteraceae bacterium]
MSPLRSQGRRPSPATDRLTRAASAPNGALAALPDAYVNVVRLGRSVTGRLDPRLRELVMIRASQLYGCTSCIAMHTRDALAAGESEQRLHALAAWPESPLFTDAERAALALCEAMTMVADGAVPADVYDRAAEWFDADELAALIFAVASINAFKPVDEASIPDRCR